MDKIPHLEINKIPSGLNTSQPTGVASNLASIAENAPQYDNVSVTQMRANPIYDGVARDTIDIIGRAQKSLADSAKIVSSRAKYIRALNDHAQRIQPKLQMKKS